jgi:uncharacterized membrane protein (DUF4010 family)
VEASVIWSFLVAALLGFLIGLERERKREERGSIFAGVRTFTLIALFGAISGQLSKPLGVAIPVLGLVALGALLTLAYWRTSAGEKIGGTSEIAALVAYGLGVLAGLDEFVVALAGAVIATAVLSFREELHSLAGAITREDLRAIVQFAAVSIIILPLVPSEALGPWGVWNPRTIWWMVVLISGISFVGYLAAKVMPPGRSLAFSGLVGGMASSTAVTLSFSERSRSNKSLSLALAAGVLAASAVQVPRMLIFVAVVAPKLVVPLLPPLLALLIVTLLGWLIIYRAGRAANTGGTELSNPFELKTALQFAVIFALVLLIARAAQEFLGPQGIYGVSFISGLTQINAITLALGDQISSGLAVGVAIKGLAIAAGANALFKAALALWLGARPFGYAVLWTLLLSAVVCVAVAWLVPTVTLNLNLPG